MLSQRAANLFATRVKERLAAFSDWLHVGDERLTLLLVVSVQLGGATQHRYGPRQRLQPAANAWRTTVCVFIICIRSMNVAAALARLLGRVSG